MTQDFTEIPPSHLRELQSKPHWWRWAIALTACLGAIMEIIDASIVNVALTHMQASLGATVAEIGWTITGYAMANVIMIPLSAWLGEVFGKKNYFIFCLIGFTIASVLCGLANTLPFLIIARIAQGLAGGGLLAKAQAVLFETFPDKREQSLAQAVFGIGVMIGPALGPVLGGYLTDNMGWPWIFFINIPFGILATICTMIFFIQDKKEPIRFDRKVDWFGILFLTLGLGALQVFLEEGHREEWFESPFILWMAVLAVVGIVLFIWQELTVDDPAVNLRVLRHPSLASGVGFSIVLGMGLYGAVFAIPIFAQSVLNFTATQTGLLLLPTAIASAIFMMISSALSQRFDARILVLAGALLMSYSLYMLSGINPNTGADDFFWPNVLRGIGTVLMFLPLTLAGMSQVPVKEVHSATGFFNLSRQIGGSIGIAILTTLLDQRTSYHRSVLVENISTYEPHVRQQLQAYAQGFAASGPGIAQGQALTVMDRMVDLQAVVMSYGDLFWLTAALFIVTIPLIFLLGSGKTTNPDVAMEVH